MRLFPLLMVLLPGCGCWWNDDCTDTEICGDQTIDPIWETAEFAPEIAVLVPVAGGDVIGEIVPLGDVDGDGTDDLAVGIGPNRVGLYRGADLAGGGVADTSAVWRELEAAAVAPGGDVDQDDQADVLAGHPAAWHLFPGAAVAAGAGTLDADSALQTFVGAEDRTLWGAIGGGDIDGDGVDDVVVAERDVRSADRDLEDVRIYPGADVASPEPLDPADYPSSYWTVVDGDTHYSMTLFGDYDGDGRADLATGAVRNFGAVTSAELMLKRKTRMLSQEELHLHECHPDDADCPNSVRVRPAGDADGDGLSDVIVIGRPTGGTWLVPGADLAAKAYKSKYVGRTPVERVEQRGAIDATGVGDLNGDGLDEVLASDGVTAWLLVSPHAACEPKFGAGVDITDASHRFEGFSSDGLGVVGPGDVDGDGMPDLLLVAPEALYFVLSGGLGPTR